MVRMPIQLGSSAARRFFSGFAYTLGGTLGAALALAIALESHQKQGFTGSLATKLLGTVVLFGFVAIGISTLRRAYRARASDAILDERGVRIEGGPHHGKHFTYAMLTPQHLALEKYSEGKAKFATRLVVYEDPRQRAPGSTELALSIDPTETQSLEALMKTLGAVSFSAGPAAHSSSGVLCCAGCGAPLVPVDQPVATCQFCGRATSMPEKLREQIRASALLVQKRPRLEKLVRKLMRQPGAASVNRLAAGLFGITLLTPVLAVSAAAYQFLTADSYRYVTILGLIEFPFFAALGSSLLLRARIVDRVALGRLTLDFSAKRSDRNEIVCRSCGGPLPVVADAAAVRCIYCASDNVLGVDLRQSAGSVAREEQSLEAALSQRTRRRFAWTAGGIASALIVLHAASLLAQGFEHNRTTDPTKHARFGPELGAFDHSRLYPAASRSGARVAYVERGDPDDSLRVTTPDAVLAKGRELRDPAWIDGSEVLYVASNGGRASLLRVSSSGGASREILSAEDIESPSASEDGSRIAYAEREGGKWFVTLLSGSERKRLGEGRMPELHPRGDPLVFIREVDGLPKPFLLDLDKPGAAPWPVFSSNPWRYADPTWAPCRSFIAVASNVSWNDLRTGSELETWNVIAVDMHKGVTFSFTHGNASARHLSWSGPRIYFDTDGHPGGLHTIYPLELSNDFIYGPYQKTCR
jgi:hypothetical protein